MLNSELTHHIFSKPFLNCNLMTIVVYGDAAVAQRA